MSIFKRIRKLYKSFRIFFQTLKSKVTGKRIPIYVEFLITKKCNLRCKYCWVEFDKFKKIEDFTTEEILDIVDQLHKAGTRVIRLLGGEPTIREDLKEIIEYIDKKGIFVDMDTNGFRVEENIEALKKLDFLTISFDGNKETMERQRGKTAYEIGIKAMEALHKNNIPFRIHAVLTKNSVEDFEYLLELSKKYSIEISMGDFALPEEEVATNGELSELYAGDDAVSNMYERMKINKGRKIAKSDSAFNYYKRWPLKNRRTIKETDLPSIPKNSYIRCYRGRQGVNIGPDGKVYPCPSLRFVGLSLKDVQFKEAWDYLDKKMDCVACKILGEYDVSMAFTLHPSILLNFIKRFVFGE